VFVKPDVAIIKIKRSEQMKVGKRNGMLSIKLPMMDEPHRSKNGKVLLVASSNGPKRTALKVQRRNVIVMVIAYIKPLNPDNTKAMKPDRKAKSARHRRWPGRPQGAKRTSLD
jgi:hypothetical protein